MLSPSGGHLEADSAGLYDPANISVVHHVNQALRANVIYLRDKDYIVSAGEVMLIDEFTGRMMHGRRLSEGLHQAIEAKEGVDIQPENQTLASVTIQNYFRLYEKLSGHDRHGGHRSGRVRRHLQDGCLGNPHQQADPAHRRRRRGLPHGSGEERGDRSGRSWIAICAASPSWSAPSPSRKSERLSELLNAYEFEVEGKSGSRASRTTS